MPSSKGVSVGPIITAFQVMTLSLTGEAEIPEGGSVCMRLKSRIRRRRAVVDMFKIVFIQIVMQVAIIKR